MICVLHCWGVTRLQEVLIRTLIKLRFAQKEIRQIRFTAKFYFAVFCVYTFWEMITRVHVFECAVSFIYHTAVQNPVKRHSILNDQNRIKYYDDGECVFWGQMFSSRLRACFESKFGCPENAAYSTIGRVPSEAPPPPHYRFGMDENPLTPTSKHTWITWFQPHTRSFGSALYF